MSLAFKICPLKDTAFVISPKQQHKSPIVQGTIADTNPDLRRRMYPADSLNSSAVVWQYFLTYSLVAGVN